ncbi:MAG: hypothetical protein ACYSUV_06495 [Planctomycetota bacterium]|jgi:hypothetical protein
MADQDSNLVPLVVSLTLLGLGENNIDTDNIYNKRFESISK